MHTRKVNTVFYHRNVTELRKPVWTIPHLGEKPGSEELWNALRERRETAMKKQLILTCKYVRILFNACSAVLVFGTCGN
jgi:hypothetical protein